MLAYGQLSIKDSEELARDMCHSVTTQAQYQFVETKGKTVMVQPELQPDFYSSSEGIRAQNNLTGASTLGILKATVSQVI